MTQRRVAVAALGVLLALVLAGCGGGDSAADDGGDDGGSGLAGDTGTGDGDGDSAEAPDDVVVLEGTEVTISSIDNTFRPENVQVAAGTTVTWTNDGRTEHNVLEVEGDDWGVEVDDFQPGATYSHTFDEPGVYEYYCSIHGTTTAGMIGTLVVDG